MNTLTDRYVYAATRYLSTARREDIALELSASVEEMVASRVAAGEDSAAAERAVLTELGNPDQLAAQYAEKPMHLIGPRYFAIYLRVTGTILLIVPLIVGIIAALAEVADDGNVGEVIGAGIGGAFSVAVHVVFWSTLTFALIDRYGTDAELPEWTVDNLPEIAAGRQVSLSDTIGSVFFTGLVAAVLVIQHFRSWIDGPDGDNVPVLEPDLWSFWLPLLIAALAASVVVDLWKYRVGRYTWPVVGGVVATSLLWLIPFVWLAAQDRLLSREFVDVLDISAANLDRINVTTIVVAIIIEVLTIGDAAWKAIQSRAAGRPM